MPKRHRKRPLPCGRRLARSVSGARKKNARHGIYFPPFAKNREGQGTRLSRDDRRNRRKPGAPGKDIKYGNKAREQIVDYNVRSMDKNGNLSPDEGVHTVELREKIISDKNGTTEYCNPCTHQRTDVFKDKMAVAGKNVVVLEKRFLIDNKAARIYDPTSQKAYDFVHVDASVANGFVFTYQNEARK